MNTTMKKDIEQYITELDDMMDKMKNSSFPFMDVLLVYQEVSDRLKGIVEQN